jgi:cell division protein FtsZ
MPLQMPVSVTAKPKEAPVVDMMINGNPVTDAIGNNKIAVPVAARMQELEPRLVETAAPPGQFRKTGPVVVMPAGTERRIETEKPVDKKLIEEPIEWIFSQDTVPTPTSGGYLIRPANIYDEEPSESETLPEGVPLKDQFIFSATAKHPGHTDQISVDMQLVFKDDIPAADVPRAHQTQPESLADQPAEEPALQDEAEGLKRRAAERINKLRNLSFNMNAADPNNEFETVPAYIRRNLELYNTVTSVESFYSQYEVKADKNSQGEISTINSFLDGKKPD